MNSISKLFLMIMLTVGCVNLNASQAEEQVDQPKAIYTAMYYNQTTSRYECMEPIIVRKSDLGNTTWADLIARTYPGFTITFMINGKIVDLNQIITKTTINYIRSKRVFFTVRENEPETTAAPVDNIKTQLETTAASNELETTAASVDNIKTQLETTAASNEPKPTAAPVDNIDTQPETTALRKARMATIKTILFYVAIYAAIFGSSFVSTYIVKKYNVAGKARSALQRFIASVNSLARKNFKRTIQHA